MDDAPRKGRGMAGPLALLVVALGVFWGVNALSSTGSPTAVPTETPSAAAELLGAPAIGPRPAPERPASVRLTPRIQRGVSPFCAHGRCCRTTVRTFGSRAPIGRVIAYFQGHRFRYAAPPLTVSAPGDPHTSGSYLRWLGERGTSPQRWRQANVATGSSVRRPAWPTVYTVSRARCTGPLAPHLAPEDWPRH